jgi:hypothetical protein
MASDVIGFWRTELRRLDLLLHRQILRLRVAYQLSLDEFRGLYVSDEQVEALVRSRQVERDVEEARVLAADSASARRRNHDGLDADHPLRRAATRFALDAVEEDLLLLALAPEIDLKYETLYAYLNNDVTRKWPSVDLAVRVLSPAPTPDLRIVEHLRPQAKLFRDGLLRPVCPGSERPSWLATGFAVRPAVCQFLLGTPAGRLPLPEGVRFGDPAVTWDDVPVSDGCRHRLEQVVALAPEDLWIVLEGAPGSGRVLAAAAACRAVGRDLLVVDVDAVRSGAASLEETLQHVATVTRLAGAGLYLDRTDTLFDAEGRALPEGRRWLALLGSPGMVCFLACSPRAQWHELVADRRSVPVGFAGLAVAQRARLWARYEEAEGVTLTAEARATVADRFLLGPRQIRDAVRALRAEATGRASGQVSVAEALAAARSRAGIGVGRLALRVPLRHGWDDVVLPPDTLAQLRELTAAIRHRDLVYRRWGFGQRAGPGRGVRALFGGPSGTGKTMCAAVIARELGLDLYRIDLAGIVSKYIGETEKNLDRIFEAAHAGNVILFFDEADALFGKRSEVKDAHDRYANIEVAYLLQKMEEHEGPVILATNLSKNVDEAFSRRMHYVVQFPIPNETGREELWRRMIPPEAPLATDVEFALLAKQFPMAGGDIRNVVLAAAFLAADDGGVITRELIGRAMARQMVKQGRAPVPLRGVRDLSESHPRSTMAFESGSALPAGQQRLT